MNRPTYITTPIYYVNDAPHIGHVFSTLLADMAARLAHLEGHATFLLTGTDEHSTKVTEAAHANGLPVAQWADNKSSAFKSAFQHFNIHFDDFIRTSEARHKAHVTRRIEQLITTGDVYLGEYSGWYDAGQEEYIPELKAKQYNYISPINKKPLIQRSESNYFFRLSHYQAPLLALLEQAELHIQPPSRSAEIVARIKEGLNDIPISRRSSETWGIPIPGDEAHIVYVWIDALFNYLTVVDNDELRGFWPADTHVVGKDILWFHAVIWPALLMALQKVEGNQWLALPKRILAHGFWIREGEKMSKSLGNFVGMADLEHYCEQFGVDGTRFYLASAGPVGANDSDFAHARFIESYNANLANTVGNCFNRVVGMVKRYFDGQVPAAALQPSAFDQEIAQLSDAAREKGNACQFDRMIAHALAIFRTIDQYVNHTEPYRLIKQPENRQHVGEILYACLSALRLGALALWPVMPASMEALLRSLGCLQDSAAPSPYATCAKVPSGFELADLGPLFPRYVETALCTEDSPQP
ncbi:methionine--tRNA ligase [Pseudomonas sp. MAFF212428]|uniref:Methionine--tRNA ligase n=1 Tax=Pseudomonas brassicae TaxID=2708063 RepID=A0A6B3NSN1_9PSED|nr:methionine--tRNA ligase [Pseudomonas brassicae]NER66352.1 methionine--tRNA ligase [Pseudomonas brassicae]